MCRVYGHLVIVGYFRSFVEAYGTKTKTESGEKANGEPSNFDPDLLAQRAEVVMLGKLHPVSLLDDVRGTLGSRLKSLAGKSTVDTVTSQIRDLMHEDLSKAKKFGAKFVLMADTWKPKSKRRRHYLAIYYVDYTDDTLSKGGYAWL